MRGRKAKPSAIKELNGNPGKRALNKNEPKPEQSIPAMPAHFAGETRKEWTRITKELHTLKIITRIDRGALVAYCQAWGDYVKACNKIKKQGEVITSDKGGLYQNPWVAIKNRSMEQLVKISAEFGMTPSSRARVKVENPTEEDEMTGFLFGNKKVPIVK